MKGCGSEKIATTCRARPVVCASQALTLMLNPTRVDTMQIPFCGWGDEGIEKVSDLPTVTQLTPVGSIVHILTRLHTCEWEVGELQDQSLSPIPQITGICNQPVWVPRRVRREGRQEPCRGCGYIHRFIECLWGLTSLVPGACGLVGQWALLTSCRGS